jgi:hypothetical protein
VSNIKEDSPEVKSMVGVVQLIAHDAQDIEQRLAATDQAADLPIWWTNMVAIAQSDIAAARDYLASISEGKAMSAMLSKIEESKRGGIR